MGRGEKGRRREGGGEEEGRRGEREETGRREGKRGHTLEFLREDFGLLMGEVARNEGTGS